MITDADIEKMKRVFATKDDLSDVRNDLVEMEKRMTKTIVNAIVEVYEVFGKQDQVLKPLKHEQQGQRVAIGDHEIRTRHLEYPAT